MDKKIYEKTRYQNIYRNIKNKNYVIMMSKPVKTSISRIDNRKIIKIEDAIKVRDDAILKQQKALEVYNKDSFDQLWNKYIDNCKYNKKQSFSTIQKKKKNYNKYFKNQIDILLSKTDNNFWAKYIDSLQTTLKQKNELIKALKTFFNWCIEENYLLLNPIQKVKKYKVEKNEMKYWNPNELKLFLNTLDQDIDSNNIKLRFKANLVKIITLIGFSIGCRTGELRALTYNSINENNKTININHSINYDTKSKDFLGTTKNFQSQRIIDISHKLINEINNYKKFMMNEMGINIRNTDLIIFNYNTNKPYTDTNLRKRFYYYCDKANVKRIRLYDLRHTFVATMMTEGWELYHISEKIGHSNYSTTVNKYGHITNQVRKELAQTTDKYY